MPGAYAHLTLVNLARDVSRLERANVPVPAIRAVLDHLGYCELGAVSPDYPYLHLGANGSKQWADLMHYTRTGEPIKAGIAFTRGLHALDKGPVAAWLLGYAAHVVADVTIHPVIELRVGKYEENATQHRICELHQDAYIFRRLNLDDVGRAEHLDSGIWRCCDAPGSGKLDRSIAAAWDHMLARTYPVQYAENKPEIDCWHAGFRRAVDVAEEGYRMPLFARHAAVDCGLTYPALEHLDRSFLEKLATPDGRMDYDQLFDKALHNAVEMWAVIGRALYEDDTAYLNRIGNWNLDTGRDAAGRYAYWTGHETVAA